MTYAAKVGSFNIDTTKTLGQTQQISGVGFQPKIVLFFWGGSTASSDTVAGGDTNTGVGAMISSSSRFCVNSYSLDAAADADSKNLQTVTECIVAYSDSSTIDGQMDFYSMDANGFTLEVDDQFSNAYRISYLALGGDDLTNVYIGNRQTPASTGQYSVTGVGFEPDAVIIVGAYGASLEVQGNDVTVSLGMATSSSNQGVVGGYTDDGAATTDTNGYGYNGEVYAMVTTSVFLRDAFVSFGSDGFTMDRLEGTSQCYYLFICLKGGQYSVGDLTTRSDSNDIEENVGFQPVAVLFASANAALDSQDTLHAHRRVSYGAATSDSERACAASSDEDNLPDSETAYGNSDSAVYLHVKDDTTEATMDIKSIDPDGFTCIMDDTETSGCWVTYLAIGPTSATPLGVSVVDTDSNYWVSGPIVVGSN